MITCHTNNVEATRALAAAVAPHTKTGDVIMLVGDLGAGKTAFVQGFAQACGVTTPVTSPTFTLANIYEGNPRINHLDVYRFESATEVGDLDLDELLDNGVTLIEWGDIIDWALPDDTLEITITFGDTPDDRILEINSSTNDQQGLSKALEPWKC